MENIMKTMEEMEKEQEKMKKIADNNIKAEN